MRYLIGEMKEAAGSVRAAVEPFRADPVIGEDVARFLGEAAPKPPAAPAPKPVHARLGAPPTAKELEDIAGNIARAYAALKLDPSLPPASGVALVDRHLAVARQKRLERPDVPKIVAPLLRWVLGDLIVRGHGWRWQFLQPSAEEKLLASIFGDLRRTAVVVSEDGAWAVDLRSAIDRRLTESAPAELLFNMLGEPRTLPARTRKTQWLS